MTYTLSELTYELAIELGIIVEGIATGGSKTTIVDINDRDEDINYWVEGTAWILKDAAGAGAAPEKEYSVIDGFEAGTVTLRNTLTVDVAAGDVYALGKKRFGLPLLIQGINRALREIGNVPFTDTSITTEGSKTEYDLPIAGPLDVREISIQTLTGNANSNLYTELHNYDIEITPIGTINKLIFQRQPEYPRTLKLVYIAPHPKLREFDDELSEEVPWERVIYRASEHVHFYYRQRTRSNESWLKDAIVYYKDLADAFDAKLPIKIPRRASNLMIVSDRRRINRYPGDRSPR